MAYFAWIEMNFFFQCLKQASEERTSIGDKLSLDTWLIVIITEESNFIKMLDNSFSFNFQVKQLASKSRNFLSAICFVLKIQNETNINMLTIILHFNIWNSTANNKRMRYKYFCNTLSPFDNIFRDVGEKNLIMV